MVKEPMLEDNQIITQWNLGHFELSFKQEIMQITEKSTISHEGDLKFH